MKRSGQHQSRTNLLLRGARLVGSQTGPVDVLVGAGAVQAIRPARSARAAGHSTFDLDGRFVLRGMWDHHVHFGQWAMTRRRLNVSAARSAAECGALVARRLREDPPPDDQPLVGFGFRDGLWSDEPRAATLDSVAAGVPVVLLSQDLHCGWLNTAALTMFGASDHATGLVREGEFYPIVQKVSQVPAHELDHWVRDAAQAAASRGVVGIVELEMAQNVENWRRRVNDGVQSLRVHCAVYAEHLDDTIASGSCTGDVVADTGGLVTMGPLKAFTDGSLNTRTALCNDPYPGLEDTPEAYGQPSLPPDELVALMRRARHHGLECAIHAIGDRANTIALDAFETSGARGSIEHAQLLDRRDLRRFAELRVAASVQPTHAVDDRDVADRHWAGRTDRAFAYAELMAAGATLRLGSDAPVAPLDPWVTVASAVHRSDGDRPPWHPNQQLSVATALDASTRGRLTVREGDRADLVVTERDPLTAGVKELRDMAVFGTLLDGDWSWRAP